MVNASMVRVGLVAAALALTGARSGRAQFAPPPPQTAQGPSPMMMMMGNPYYNPMVNPGIYPNAGGRPLTGGNALLYMYASNSANGGIGSGRLSGYRPDPAAAPAASGRRPKTSEVPNTAPRAGGAAYFTTGPTKGFGGGPGRMYNQRSRYFSSSVR